MGICRESEKGGKGDIGPKGDSCTTMEGIGPNTTYIGSPGPKGMEGVKVCAEMMRSTLLLQEYF